MVTVLQGPPTASPRAVGAFHLESVGWWGHAAAPRVVTHVFPARLGLRCRACAFSLAHGDVTRLPGRLSDFARSPSVRPLRRTDRTRTQNQLLLAVRTCM